jgi:superfamily II RNA helicase
LYKRRQPLSRSPHRSRETVKEWHIRPAADAGLKKIFAAIGVPDQQRFKPDRFQVQAVDTVAYADCLVTAPTGAGKTWIAEQAIARVRKDGGNSWYACPLKALSNAKYAEFSEIFGPEQVGILTGDRKENPDASIIVGTTEILRNQLYDAMHRGEFLKTDFVVLDEAHFLGDEDRGVVWEEIMIYLPARIPLLLLSATIGNAGQISAWLSSIRSTPCMVIEETQRPVPLFPLFLHPSGTLLPLTASDKSASRPRLHKKVAEFVKTSQRRRTGQYQGLPPFADVLQILRKFDLLPAIFFLKSRADCDQALELCRSNPILDPQRKNRLKREMEESVRQTPHIAAHRQRWYLEHLAVGSHHSGQLPAWKLVLEKLMTAGLLDAVFATSTVAAGVNFPARTVAFMNSDRFNGQHFLPLTATEFHQMTGRAGRRGMDKIGFALVLPNRFMDVRLIAKLLPSPPSEVVSQIKINFSMVLNLLLSHTPNQIEALLKKSFAAYLMARRHGRRGHSESHRHLWQDFLRHLDFLEESGYVSAGGKLTEDGKWASQLRVDQPLLIAEGFRRELFPVSNPELLAAVFAAFVNEREADDRLKKKRVSASLLQAFTQVTKGLTPFARKMAAAKFDVRPLFLRPAAAVYAWAQGGSWENVLAIAEQEEGDVAMLILRTADNLRHICNLRDVFPEAADSARKSIGMIMREPVVTF